MKKHVFASSFLYVIYFLIRLANGVGSVGSANGVGRAIKFGGQI